MKDHRAAYQDVTVLASVAALSLNNALRLEGKFNDMKMQLTVLEQSMKKTDQNVDTLENSMSYDEQEVTTFISIASNDLNHLQGSLGVVHPAAPSSVSHHAQLESGSDVTS
ncbi:hypothetical protein PR001_g201 [Phytophthora rubi]|uniref:Uncharacterized protein n=1 Tax=Phytophthora rubi TaxID=129364 RepID=A0A6A3PD69_9STRA|nr:hypothetical protein PR001_g201 [Phytophthora rubi]